jgi:hypothetical protein
MGNKTGIYAGKMIRRSHAAMITYAVFQTVETMNFVDK